jgi:hypothetical protein
VSFSTNSFFSPTSASPLPPLELSMNTHARCGERRRKKKRRKEEEEEEEGEFNQRS